MEKTPIKTFAYAADIGANIRGSGDGPSVLQKSELFAQSGIELNWHDLIDTPQVTSQLDAIPAISDISIKIAAQILSHSRDGDKRLIFGGDQTVSIGTWSAIAEELKPKGDIGLLWIDAHMDSHTPETSETGNVHGMALACLLGYGDPRLTQLLNSQAKLKPENVCLIGIRSFEKGEAELLKKLNVKIYFQDEVDKRGLDKVFNEALKHVKQNTIKFGISLDIDSMDPELAPGVGVPEANGIKPRELIKNFKKLHNDEKFTALEIVEFNPHRDIDRKTEKIVPQLVKAVYGSEK